MIVSERDDPRSGADDETAAAGARQPPLAKLADPYELVSVQAVAAPNGTHGASWHRYDILQGSNRIVGYREGGMQSVTAAAEAIVVRLNERRILQRGKVHLALQSSRKQETSRGEGGRRR